jgi:hypothetical protein
MLCRLVKRISGYVLFNYSSRFKVDELGKARNVKDAKAVSKAGKVKLPSVS